MAVTYTTTPSGRSLNQMEITGWVIEYWDLDTYSVSYFSSLDGTWREAPDKNIIYVWFYLGEYITILKGADHYFFVDDAIFGCFQNFTLSETSNAGPGSYYYIEDQELIHIRTPDHTRPAFVMNSDVKNGVWVIEPFAAEIGLSHGSRRPRITPELRKYR